MNKLGNFKDLQLLKNINKEFYCRSFSQKKYNVGHHISESSSLGCVYS